MIKTISFHKWKYKSYKRVFLKPRRLNRMLTVKKEKLIIFDARQSDEYAKEHLIGATHVNAPFLWDNISSVKKENWIIIVSTNKRTNAIEASKGRKAGFKKIFITVMSDDIDEVFVTNNSQQQTEA